MATARSSQKSIVIFQFFSIRTSPLLIQVAVAVVERNLSSVRINTFYFVVQAINARPSYDVPTTGFWSRALRSMVNSADVSWLAIVYWANVRTFCEVLDIFRPDTARHVCLLYCNFDSNLTAIDRHHEIVRQKKSRVWRKQNLFLPDAWNICRTIRWQWSVAVRLLSKFQNFREGARQP